MVKIISSYHHPNVNYEVLDTLQHLHISRLLLLKHIGSSATTIQSLMGLCSISRHHGVFILHFYLLITFIVLDPQISYSSPLADCSDDLSTISHLEPVKGQLVQHYHEQYMHNTPPPHSATAPSTFSTSPQECSDCLCCHLSGMDPKTSQNGQLHSPIQAVTQSNSK